MRAVIQRVKRAVLSVGGAPVSEIGLGLAVYLGIDKGDTRREVDLLAKKIARLRILEDGQGKMNRSVLDEGKDILLISQFTLCADLSSGNRPSFAGAEEPVQAKALYDAFAAALCAYGIKVRTGVFGADMIIEQCNDGPVTIVMDS